MRARNVKLICSNCGAVIMIDKTANVPEVVKFSLCTRWRTWCR